MSTGYSRLIFAACHRNVIATSVLTGHGGRSGHRVVDYSAFAVVGQPDLSLVIFTPATSADADRIKDLIARR
jgi:hypothetical protein